MNFHNLKEYLKSISSFNTENKSAEEKRVYRKAVSQLSKEGIIFISDHNHNFKRIEIATADEKNRYATEQVNHVKSTYLNRIKPIKQYISDELLINTMGQLDLLEQL